MTSLSASLQGVLVEYTPTFYFVESGHNLLCHNNHNIFLKILQVLSSHFTLLFEKV